MPTDIQTVLQLSGDAFRAALADFITTRLGLDCAFVARLDAGGRSFRADLLGAPPHAPCDGDLPAALLPPADGPAVLSPGDPLLADASSPFGGGRFRTGVAVPLRDTRGEGLGHLVGLARRPLPRPEEAASALAICAVRVAAELEREMVEGALAEERRLSRAILDAIPTPVFCKDAGGTYLDCNRAFEQAIGIPRDELRGKTPFDIAPEQFAAVYRKADEAVLRGDGPQTYESPLVFASGEPREVLFSKTAFCDRNGDIAGLVGTVFDVTERRRAEEAARYLEHFDPLTQLPNQVLFTDRINMEIATSQRLGRHFALITLDLDQFKKINNAFGHDHGDQLLQKLARRLRAFLREGDTISRMGGDSFNLLLPDIPNANDLNNLGRRIMGIVAQPFTIDGVEIIVSASLGIAAYPLDGADAQTLLKHAGIALHQAKEQGRNTLRFYAAEMNARARERMLTESQLRRALENDEFALHYQPQVDAASGRIIGAEALLRWRHPERGLLTPHHFIDLAEETGLIVPIGAWVLREACARGRAWQDAGLPPLRLGVNLSPRQFQQHDLYETVMAALAAQDFPPASLSLEITESVLMKDTDHAITTLVRLKGLGVHLAVDDFGTGYSSLSYVKNLPIDMLKIDRSFVMDLPESPEDMAIVSAIIGMGHTLGMEVLAEGVQSGPQQAFLRERGCDELQGFLFSQPLPEEEFVLKLRPDTDRWPLAANCA